MNTLIVIPVRGLRGAKSRLATLFDEDERDILVCEMVAHLVAQLPEGVDRAIITRNPEALRRMAPSIPILTQSDDYPGLNGSLQQVLNQARDAGYKDMLMLPGDLPLVQSHEIEALLLEEGTIVLAGDRDQEGTNGLRLPTRFADSFRFGMGIHSFVHHLAEARLHGVGAITVYHRGLAHDLDTPDDWDALPVETRARLTRSMQLAGKGA